ncbi:hypothetical protein Pint_06279 [Pistacia integerrima]|uniref:Uncharacterized protein n=1 Tax=Pistacia integerrima TaxID=434235 RepID=A0ACC0Z3P4_9ROSI|nr:hypothetical protein Pint_06279 [Pistacia integerrima]
MNMVRLYCQLYKGRGTGDPQNDWVEIIGNDRGNKTTLSYVAFTEVISDYWLMQKVDW